MESLTKELQKKRAERIARLNAGGETTGSDLSSVSPSLPEDDKRSLNSEGFLHASQTVESPGEGGGGDGQQQQQQQQQLRVKRNKTQLWNEVKVTCKCDVVSWR